MINFSDNGLVGCWDFNGNCNDKLGFNNLTLQNVNTGRTYYTDGYRGKALRVGVSSATTTDMSYMNGTDPFNNVLRTAAATVDVIMSTTSGIQGNLLICFSEGVTSGNVPARILLYINTTAVGDTAVLLYMISEDSTTNTSYRIRYATTSYTLRKYPYFNRFTLTATGNASTPHAIYINGEPVAWATKTNDIATHNGQWLAYSKLDVIDLFTIGAYRYGSSTTPTYTTTTASTTSDHYYLDTVRIYDYAKTDVQIKNEQCATQRFI